MKYRDPFAPILRKQRLQAQILHWRRRFLRPWRPSRLAPRREGPANLVMVGVDTLRRDHVGVGLTPFLEAQVAAGVDFADVTASAPWTLPSFASAFTGLMPSLHGAVLPGTIRNMDTQPPCRLKDGTVTLARHLGGRGYRTAAFYANQFFAFGLAESFDEHHYLNLAADDILKVAADWIRRHADQPFFCFVLLNDPHEPTTPGDPFLQPELDALDLTPPSLAELRHLTAWGDPDHAEAHLGHCGWPLPPSAERAKSLKRAIYRACVRQIDQSLATFFTRLEGWGLKENTLNSVFSDHGEEFCDHAAEAQSWNHDPRRVRGVGHGHTQFQELLRVPWVNWGAGVPSWGAVKQPVSLLDLAPTLANWLGMGPFHLPDAGCPGLVGQALTSPDLDPERVLLAEALAYGPDVVAVRQDNWKLVAQRDGKPLGLYDLHQDPRERNDLTSAEPGPLRRLQAILATWRDCNSSGPKQGEAAPAWSDLDDEVRQRLKDLGYGE